MSFKPHEGGKALRKREYGLIRLIGRITHTLVTTFQCISSGSFIVAVLTYKTSHVFCYNIQTFKIFTSQSS